MGKGRSRKTTHFKSLTFRIPCVYEHEGVRLDLPSEKESDGIGETLELIKGLALSKMNEYMDATHLRNATSWTRNTLLPAATILFVIVLSGALYVQFMRRGILRE